MDGSGIASKLFCETQNPNPWDNSLIPPWLKTNSTTRNSQVCRGHDTSDTLDVQETSYDIRTCLDLPPRHRSKLDSIGRDNSVEHSEEIEVSIEEINNLRKSTEDEVCITNSKVEDRPSKRDSRSARGDKPHKTKDGTEFERKPKTGRERQSRERRSETKTSRESQYKTNSHNIKLLEAELMLMGEKTKKERRSRRRKDEDTINIDEQTINKIKKVAQSLSNNEQRTKILADVQEYLEQNRAFTFQERQLTKRDCEVPSIIQTRRQLRDVTKVEAPVEILYEVKNDVLQKAQMESVDMARSTRGNPFKVKLDIWEEPVRDTASAVVQQLRADIDRCLKMLQQQVDIVDSKLRSITLEKCNGAGKIHMVITCSEDPAETNISHQCNNVTAADETQSRSCTTNISTQTPKLEHLTKSTETSSSFSVKVASQTEETWSQQEENQQPTWQGTPEHFKQILDTYFTNIRTVLPAAKKDNTVQCDTIPSIETAVLNPVIPEDTSSSSELPPSLKSAKSPNKIVFNVQQGRRKRKELKRTMKKERPKTHETDVKLMKLLLSCVAKERWGSEEKSDKQSDHVLIHIEEKLPLLGKDKQDNSEHEAVARGNFSSKDVALELDLTASDLELILNNRERKWLGKTDVVSSSSQGKSLQALLTHLQPIQ